MFSSSTDLGEVCSSVWLPWSQQAVSHGWLTSQHHLPPRHEMPSDPTQRSQSSWWNNEQFLQDTTELCYCGTGRLDKISRPQHSLCQQTQVGCSFCSSYRARGSRLWNTMFIEIGFHLRNPIVASASRCAFCLQLSSLDAFPLFVLGGRQHLCETHSCTR